MALDWRTDERSAADDRLNPAELQNREHESIPGCDRSNDGLDDHPISGGVADGEDPSNTGNIDAARQAESTPGIQGGWANNVSGGSQGKTGLRKFLTKTALKRGAPFGIVGGGLIGLTSLTSFFAIPGAIVTNITEIVTQRWNFQQVQMQRSNRLIMDQKLGGKASCSKLTIRCKFQTFSKAELAALEKQGITVEGGKDSLNGGRKKATKLTMVIEEKAGQTKTVSYSPKEAIKEFNRPNSALRNSMITAYNPNLFGYSDKSFFKAARDKLKISKRKPLDDADKKSEEALKKKMKKTAEEGSSTSPKGGETVDCGGEGKPACTEEDKKKNSEAEKGNALQEEVDKVKKSGKKTLVGSLSSISSSLMNKIGIVGHVQDACDVLNYMNMIESGSKAIRALQMARVAWMIAVTGHLIKSGDATPDDVRPIADLLTKTVTKDVEVNGKKSNITTRAATDSFGFRNAAFKDKGMTEIAMQYSSGGTFNATLTKIRNAMYAVVGGKSNAKTTCKFVNNMGVQILSGAIGIASLFVGVGIIKAAAQTVAGITLEIAMQQYIVPMMINTLAGVVFDDNTFGEPLGDIFATGYQVTASTVANVGGGIPLSPEQAAANAAEMDIVAQENALYERSTRSPWDINSPYTMVGSIFSHFVPYMTQFSSVQGSISAFSDISLSSLRGLVSPPSKALGVIETAADYTSTDESYSEANIGTTPQGTPVIGLPKEVLDIDPDKAYAYLMGHYTRWKDANGVWHEDPEPHIDMETGEPKSDKYKKFIEKCPIARKESYNSDSEDIDDDWGGSNETTGVDDCMVNGKDYDKTKLPTNRQPSNPTLDPDVARSDTTQDDVMTATERKYFLAWNNHLRNIQNREEGFKAPSGVGESNAANTQPTGPAELGQGSGSFTDNGQVNGWESVLANAKASEAAYGSRLVANGRCAAIVSRVWRGKNVPYGYPWAVHMWERTPDSKKHTDRNPPKGAILLYKKSKFGHVVIYLGGNKILNDGHIENADFVEKNWGQKYLGWIDPNDVGWTSTTASDITKAVAM